MNFERESGLYGVWISGRNIDENFEGVRIEKLIRIVLIGSLFGFSGCATMKESIGTGIVTGAITGLVLGPVIDRSAPDAQLGGALIGAAVGGIASYFIHKGLDDRDANVRKETLFNLDKYNVSRPSGSDSGMNYEYGLAAPSVETQCYDTEVKGDKLVQAHCESKIIGSPEWVKGSKKKNSNE